MERKSFERGTIVGGIVRIVISIVGIIVASIVLASAIQNWDSDDIGGGIFMCVIAGFIIIMAVTFIVYGIRMIINGKKSIVVSKKGIQKEAEKLICLLQR